MAKGVGGFRRKEKTVDTLDQQQKARELKVNQILDKYKQMENTR
jgi:hypothetical protein